MAQMTRRGRAKTARLFSNGVSTLPLRVICAICGLEKSMSKNPVEEFDYHIECDDFLLYELARLIEEDRASFEDEEFFRLIDAGIHEHIERRLDIRANLAVRLRTSDVPP